MNYCENCGELLKDDAAFCPNCGTPNPNYSAPDAEKAPEAPKAEPAPEAPKAEPAPEAPKGEPAPEAPKAEPAPEAPKPEPAPEAPKPAKKKVSAGKKIGIILGIAAALLVLLIGGLIAAYFIPYSLANKAVDAGDAAKADRLLYLKPVTKLHDGGIVAYVEAAKLYDEGKYKEAADAFKAIADYKDSLERSREATLKLADGKLADGNAKDAIGIYEALAAEGVDCGDKLNAAKLKLAEDTLKKGDFDEAIEMLTALNDGGYSPAKAKLDDAWFLKAGALAENGKYPEAKEILARLMNEGYDGAGSKLNEVKYAQAESVLDKGDRLSALAIFEDLAEDDYSDSRSRAVELLSDLARESAQAKKLSETQDLLDRLAALDEGAANGIDLEIREMYAALTEEGSTAFVHYWKDRYDEKGDGEAYDYFILSVHNIFSSDMQRMEYAAFSGETGFYPDEQFPELFSDIDDFFEALESSAFSDRREDQCYDPLRLKGRWSGSGFFFYLEDDGSITYNLPWFDFGDYYYIFDHQILLHSLSTGEERPLFEITFISDTEIEIYCYKDGSTHTLTKE